MRLVCAGRRGVGCALAGALRRELWDRRERCVDGVTCVCHFTGACGPSRATRQILPACLSGLKQCCCVSNQPVSSQRSDRAGSIDVLKPARCLAGSRVGRTVPRSEPILHQKGADGGCDVRLATYNYRTNQACNLQPRTLEPAATCNQQNPRTRNVLVCRYARSLRLAARQNTPAFDGAFYRPNGTSYQLQPSFHTYSTEPEPTARARRAGKELY